MSGLKIAAIIWGIWAIYNLFVFLLYGNDKRRARRDEWRIPEKVLLLCTGLMGGVGAVLGMKHYHHKTRHMRFVVISPVSAALQLAAMLYLTYLILRTF